MGAQRILILDDSEIALEIARAALEGAGYSVTTVGSVLDFEREFPKAKPDAIMTDINMPEMYGDDVCMIFKESFGVTDIPIILFSDIEEEELKIRTQKSGANGYVCKRWGPEKLVETVKKILAGKGL